jgi:hypothetical protein
VLRAGESNCFRYYKRLGAVAKLATGYIAEVAVQGQPLDAV